MSSPCCTQSPHEVLLAKTKDACQRTEAKWHLVSEGELNPMSSDDENMAEIGRRKLRGRLEKRPMRAKEEAERRAQEDMERENAAWRAMEAAKERAEAKRRALKERLWEVVGQQSAMAVAPPASGVQDPCTRCHNKGTPCVFGAAKGKTTACKVYCHAKVSCSWTKRMAGKTHKQKWVQQSEDAEEKEVIDVDTNEEEDEEWSHFAVPTHLTEEHRDTLGALTATLDTLSMEFYEFRRDYWGFSAEVLKVMDSITQELKRANDLKEEEMGRAKGKGKEKAQEEYRRVRTEDDNGDTEMGGAGPLSLVLKEKKNLAWGSEVGLHRLRVWSWLAGVPLVEVPNEFGGVPQLHG
ncbi:hypothetical protein ID866_12117 [Astraeus odoratus]|nr:hypothetical protein ID866_12117 [Astraeus odoratus]